MSSTTDDFDPDELPDPICEFCGFPIQEQGQDCIALEDGECAP